MFCKNCGNQLNDNNKYCNICGKSVENKDTFVEKNKIIEHLKIAKILETRIYELNSLINNLNVRVENLRIKRKLRQPSYDEYTYAFYWLILFPIVWIIVSLSLIFNHEEHPIAAILLIYYSTLKYYKKAAIIAIIISAIAVIIRLLLIKMYNISKKLEYKAEIQKRDKEYADNIKMAAVLEKEQLELKQTLEQTNNYLKKIYSVNILFPKYRNMIAVITIYEYFLSGRCNELTGHEGAYNIYENELRQNIIINSLEAIQYSLEQIKQNQFMLYEAIRESGNRINSLSHEFDSLSNSINSLSDNSKIVAYNSKIMADNTEVIKYINLMNV